MIKLIILCFLLPVLLFAQRRAKVELAIAGFDYSTNHINTVHHDFPTLDGSHLVVSVKEEGPDTSDIDLRGRFLSTALQSPGTSSHATIMSTIIAGAGNSFYTSRGVAPAGTISSASFEQLTPDSDAAYRKYHISVQNHSYGTGIENYYGSEAAAYDASVINKPSLLQIFSAGNSGDEADSVGIYKGLKGWANLTGNFKMAKNILTVGSIDSFYTVESLSSKGPAYDGRIKPELVAYGEDGSSGAAALVSGTALLLQQAYRDSHEDSLPDAALVKALLLNTAEDVGNAGIDFSSGFGSLDAWRAVKEIEAGHFFSGNIAQAQQMTFSLSVPAGARQLKVMLCWTDPPAVANTPTALVNDLDLHVNEWQPWVLSAAANADSLSRLPVRGRDSLNNVEQVTIDSPAAGDYLLRVTGSSTIRGNQRFYVAYQWDTANAFRWMYPTTGDNLLPGVRNILRWQTNWSGQALLEYQLVGQGRWISITSGAVAGRFLPWLPPDTTALAVLRMSFNGGSILSDTFSISTRLQTKVGFNCPDSVLLYWDRSETGSYALYRLGERYMELQQVLSDTAVVLPGSGDSWYAVAPLLPGNRPALRSYAFDYTQQGVGCYFSSFTADLAGDKADLLLSLGSDYKVASVGIEKATSTGFHPLASFSPSGLTYAAIDEHVTQGANTYRAVLTMEDHSLRYSDLQTVYYTGGRDYFVYPNPVYRPGSIHVLAAGLNNPVFRLYSMTGQLLQQRTLTGLVEDISTSTLSRGVYIYTLDTPDGNAVRGRIIVL